MCRISECAKMKREIWSREGWLRMKNSERREFGKSGLYKARGRIICIYNIYFLSPSSVCAYVRSIVSLRIWMCSCGYITESGSHFQFNLLKARQKVIRYFTGTVDRNAVAAYSFTTFSGVNVVLYRHEWIHVSVHLPMDSVI